jgi:UDP-N-acetylglucosamine 2-epimerase
LTGAGLHVFLGTKAQYIKTAPLLRLLDERGATYRLIDSGQHAELSAALRRELGVRAPDLVLGGAGDVDSVPQALRWAVGLATRLGSRRRLRREVFGGGGGLCVVHGDTPSTLLATLLARRAGLRVAHLEAGLRSHDLLHPFPEEAIRLVVMRCSAVLFAPTAAAAANLAAMGVRGRVVTVAGNTSVEALGSLPPAAGERGPVIVTMHRVENLYGSRAAARLVDLVVRLAAERPVRFVVHGPTREVLARRGALRRLADAGVDLQALAPHADFLSWLRDAPFVITDGGSIQEECALLGVPTLLWRARTERPDGIGANVVLSRYEPAVVDTFLADAECLRRPVADLGARPSEHILDVLLDEVAQPAR